MEDKDMMNIDKSMFEFAQKDEKLHDTKLDAKRVGYFKDAFMRFRKNKGSVVGGIIIILLLLFAIFVPIFGGNSYANNIKDNTYLYYKKLMPKSSLFAGLGFWDGCKTEEMNVNSYNYYNAIGVETGCNPIVAVKDFDNVERMYTVKSDSYYKNGMVYMTLTKEEYQNIQKWQDENEIQVIYPAVDLAKYTVESFKTDANRWYVVDQRGFPMVDASGNYEENYLKTGTDNYTSKMRIASDPYNSGDTENAYRYARLTGSSTSGGYYVRIFTYNYFIYKYGFEPAFLFGTNDLGQDLFTRLAEGARFSFLLALFISMINLTIGAIYGAIEGYYGGAVDLTMERISDILANVPFIVVVTLFNLHLSKQVGALGSLLFAFVTTGWIGTAGTVRMQFYRFKNQEYVLAARTLGASNARIMFKHIFPNALGTIVTSSILVIPSVIFSESMLSYLGIINLETSGFTSVGTLLSQGQGFLSTYPHILLFPAIFVSLLMISFNLFGNGLRDAFNPSLRGSED